MDSNLKPLYGIKAQTAAALDALEKSLASQKATLSDVVKVTVFVTDMDNYEVVNNIYAERFKKPYPARTFVGVRKICFLSKKVLFLGEITST